MIGLPGNTENETRPALLALFWETDIDSEKLSPISYTL